MAPLRHLCMSGRSKMYMVYRPYRNWLHLLNFGVGPEGKRVSRVAPRAGATQGF